MLLAVLLQASAPDSSALRHQPYLPITRTPRPSTTEGT